MTRCCRVFAVAALLVSGTAALAQDRVQVGMLECRGSTTSFIVGSVTELGCTFQPSAGPPDFYRAQIKRVGVDIGPPQQVAVGWAVFAPTRNVLMGGLAGNYVGASASATFGVGVGANALVGGSGNTIALQPVSLQGQVGLSVAAGVAEMTLRPGR
jgi:hypothetical protein